jgi:hypothetical protein
VAESLLKRKVLQGEITPSLIRLCVHGRGVSSGSVSDKSLVNLLMLIFEVKRVQYLYLT